MTTFYNNLEIIADFFNTHDKRTRYEGDEGVEHFESPDDLYSWLLEFQFISEKDAVTEDDLALAIQLRNEARKMITNNDFGEAAYNSLDNFNNLITEFKFSLAFYNDHEELISNDIAGRKGIAKLILLIFELKKNELWHRLRVCSAEDCQWVFVDHSRPGTAKWCTMKACGNRAKNKTYRQKIKNSEG